MKKKIFISIAGLLLVLFACTKPNPQIVIETSYGNIVAELYAKEAPLTVANFLQYVDSGLFTDACFYRIVKLNNQPNNDIKIEVVQGGRYNKDDDHFPPVKHETTDVTGIKHKNGVLSMARWEPGSATSEFSICVGDQPELDFGGKRNKDGQGFAAFGKVIKGMDVVLKIHSLDAPEQYLTDTIPIKRIYRNN
jgi:peptidyl-prolyl cis-trans isomerase A (cyclophilin A)